MFKVKEKDIENLTKVLVDKSIALMIENEELKSKVKHLEELLKNTPSIGIVGGKGE
jgi:hypothetical protein